MAAKKDKKIGTTTVVKELKPASKSTATAEKKPIVKSEMKTTAKAAMKTTAKSEMKTTAKAAMKTNAKAEMKTNAKTEKKPKKAVDVKKSLKETKKDQKMEVVIQRDFDSEAQEPLKKFSSDTIDAVEAAILEAEVEDAFKTFVEEAMSIDYASLEKGQLIKLRRSFNVILKRISGVLDTVEQRHTELLMSVLVLGDLFVDTLEKYSTEIVEHMTRDGLRDFAQRLYNYRQQINLVREKVMAVANSGEKR